MHKMAQILKFDSIKSDPQRQLDYQARTCLKRWMLLNTWEKADFALANRRVKVG